MSSASATRVKSSKTESGKNNTVEGVEEGLRQERIVRAAKGLIAEVGVDGLTMRRLSDDLGVALGATYHYVPNRHALLTLVAQSIQDDIDLPDPAKGKWIDNVRALLVGYVATVGPYPGMASFILANPEASSPRVGSAMRSYLNGAGFSRAGSETVLNALFFYVAGTMASGLTTKVKGVSQRTLDERFNSGLEVLLKGVAAELKDDRRRS